MNNTQIKKFCKALRVQTSSDKTKGWVQAPCPLARYTHQSGKDSNPSFGIEIKNGRSSTAHCFTCGFAGDLVELIIQLRYLAGKNSGFDFKQALKLAEADEQGGGMDLAYAEEEMEEAKDETWYFPQKWLDTFPDCENSEKGLLYCESKRDLPLWVIRDLDLKYDPVEKRVCFPIRDEEGALIGLHGRGVNKKVKPLYRMYTYPLKKGHNNPKYWYGEEWVDWNKPVVVVESVFDLASVYRVYRNVICPLTAEVSKQKIQRIQDALFLILMFDSDKPGRKASYKIKKQLSHISIADIRLPEGQDPGDLSIPKIKKILKPHLDNVLTG